MSKTWLVLDCNNLCFRAHYSTGSLSYGGVMTGVSYGFFKELITLKNYHDSENYIFCFDYGKSKRKKIFPDYKANRFKDKTQEQVSEYEGVKEQISQIRDEYLPNLGFENIIYERGYEADDMIATVVQNSIPPEDDALIISGDKDLYQLLRKKKILLWKPQQKTIYTPNCLARDFHGITPEQWHVVKSLAGCSTDNIPGIPGVGEITAAKFLTGKLNKDSKLFHKIESSMDLVNRNMELVRLPLEGVSHFGLKKDNNNPDLWMKFLRNKLGIKTMKGFL